MIDKISVILPCYNGAQWIDQAVESILLQTFKNLELIIVDDGSKDKSKDIVYSYLSDTRVRYVYQENRGFSAAINRGISESTGDLIGFIGQDDLWMPYKLDLQVKFLAKNQSIDFVHGNYCEIDLKGNFLRERKIRVPRTLDRKKFIQELFLENFIGFETVLIKKDVLIKAGPFDERMVGFSDHDMWLRIAKFSTAHYLDTVLVKKRHHKLQITKKTELVSKDEFLIVSKMVNRYPYLRKVERKKLASLYFMIGIDFLRKGYHQKSKESLLNVIKYKPWTWKAIIAYFAPNLYNHIINMLSGNND